MRKLILFIGALGCLHISFSQETPKTIRKTQTPQKVKAISVKPANTIVFTDTLKGETLAHIDYVISAIDSKVESVKNDPVQFQKAESIGWFKQMEDSRNSWVKRRDALIIYLESQKK